MKRLLVLLSIGAVLSGSLRAGPGATNEHAVNSAGVESVKAYRESKLLELPVGMADLEWRIVQGQVGYFDEKARSWTKGENSFLPEKLEGDWEVFTIGESPAVGREPFQVDFSIGEEFDFKALAFVNSKIVEVGRKLVSVRENSLIPELSVFIRQTNEKRAVKIATFPFNDDLFQYRLASVFPLSNGLIGIVAATDHLHVSSVILFDLKKKRPVGYLPFSALQYLPRKKAFWVARPITKGEQGSQPSAAEMARAEARIIPIWIKGGLNPELAESELFSLATEEGKKTEPSDPHQE